MSINRCESVTDVNFHIILQSAEKEAWRLRMSSIAWLRDNDISFLHCHPLRTPTGMRCTTQLCY